MPGKLWLFAFRNYLYIIVDCRS